MISAISARRRLRRWMRITYAMPGPANGKHVSAPLMYEYPSAPAKAN